jgi:hypothetical protein
MSREEAESRSPDPEWRLGGAEKNNSKSLDYFFPTATQLHPNPSPSASSKGVGAGEPVQKTILWNEGRRGSLGFCPWLESPLA